MGPDGHSPSDNHHIVTNKRVDVFPGIRERTAWILPLLFCITARAQWSNDPATNTLVCDTTLYQFQSAIVSDGSGGAIIVWTDTRRPADSLSVQLDLFAQRLDSSGRSLWTRNGIGVTTALAEQFFPLAVTDGAGGAIVAWLDHRGDSYQVYAERISGGGAVLWGGVPVAPAANRDQVEHRIIGDGAGGAVIVWTEIEDSGTSVDIYAQRLTAGGSATWGSHGSPVITAASDQNYAAIASDGSGGAIISWTHYDFDPDAAIYTHTTRPMPGRPHSYLGCRSSRLGPGRAIGIVHIHVAYGRQL